MHLRKKFILLWLALGSLDVWSQDIFLSASRVRAEGLVHGQIAIDISTLTHHPAYLEPQSLKTPDGVKIISSSVPPDNVRTCPRAGASQSECRQIFRVILDTGQRCHAGGDYETLFRVACWPGTAASLCTPGAYQQNFKLGNEPTC